MRRLVILAATITLLASITPAAPAQERAVPTGRAHVTASSQRLGHQIGSIEIPALGLTEVIREGIDMSVINRGVAHWSGTAIPGGEGNLVLAGHRTTYSRPFYYLDRLEPGDQIIATGLDGQRATYRVTETIFVGPSDVWIADRTANPMLTMFACHPRGSARQRIVVRAALVDAPLVFP